MKRAADMTVEEYGIKAKNNINIGRTACIHAASIRRIIGSSSKRTEQKFGRPNIYDGMIIGRKSPKIYPAITAFDERSDLASKEIRFNINITRLFYV